MKSGSVLVCGTWTLDLIKVQAFHVESVCLLELSTEGALELMILLHPLVHLSELDSTVGTGFWCPRVTSDRITYTKAVWSHIKDKQTADMQNKISKLDAMVRMLLKNQVVYDALGLRYGGRHEKICCRTHSPSNVFCVDVLTSLLLLCFVLVSYDCMDCYFYYVLFWLATIV